MWIQNFIHTVGVPILVAVLTYLLVDRLGEYKKRRDYSKLGVAIIESLLEEIDTGIDIMTKALEAADSGDLFKLPSTLLPNKSWDGMTTIPDEVLLRIIATSSGKKFESFLPRQCRIHCKNYFVNITANYKNAAFPDFAGANNTRCSRIHDLLADDGSKHLSATRGVKRMLEDAKKLLEENARAIFPK